MLLHFHRKRIGGTRYTHEPIDRFGINGCPSPERKILLNFFFFFFFFFGTIERDALLYRMKLFACSSDTRANFRKHGITYLMRKFGSFNGKNGWACSNTDENAGELYLKLSLRIISRFFVERMLHLRKDLSISPISKKRDVPLIDLTVLSRESRFMGPLELCTWPCSHFSISSCSKS